MAGDSPPLTLKKLEEQVRGFGPVSLCVRPPLPLKTALGSESEALLQGNRITPETRLKDISTALQSDYENHKFHWLMDERVLDSDTPLARLSLDRQRHPMRGTHIDQLSHGLSLLANSVEHAASYSDIDETVRFASHLIKKAESHDAISAIEETLSKKDFWNNKLADWQQADLQTLVNAQKCYLGSSSAAGSD